MTPVPGHPYVSYRTFRDAYAQFVIECRCAFCGAYWRKHCLQPHRWQDRVFEFARVHGHGVSPRPKQAAR